MSFDLGGFLGGIIGTVGAFGVAFWTFHHEKERTQPSKRRKQIEVGLRLFNIVYYAPPHLGRSGMALNDVFNNMQKTIIEPLDKLVPDAFEAGGEVYTILQRMRKNFIDVTTQFFTDSITDFAEQMGSVEVGSEFFRIMAETAVGYLAEVKRINDNLQKPL